MTVGERIVEARKAKGISQKQLAEMAGIPLQTLVRYEKGVSENIPMGRLQAIADALEVVLSVLMGFEKPVPTTKHANLVIEVLQESGLSNEEILSSFSTQELLIEIERRCSE